jgi:hypothetical protein
MKAPEEKPTVQLTGQDGNAFAVLARVRNMLRRSGADQEYLDKYTKEATSGDYDHLLATTMDYVIVE